MQGSFYVENFNYKGGFIMDMGITENIGISYSTESRSSKKTTRENTGADTSVTETNASKVTDKAEETSAATYEKTSRKDRDSSKQLYKPDMDTVQKLKNDAETRSAQLRNLVEQMLTKQGKTFNNSTNIYDLLRTGKVTVDPATAAQAQEDISEDGYWGVKQTSDRLVSFAKALTGGDPSKADEMIEAFKKGYKQAAKSWGGDLPGICQQTYDATIEKLTEWKNSLNANNTDTTTAAEKAMA